MFDLHHAQSSRRYFDREYFKISEDAFFIRQACVCRHFAASITHIAPRQNGKIALTPLCPTSAVNHVVLIFAGIHNRCIQP